MAGLYNQSRGVADFWLAVPHVVDASLYEQIQQVALLRVMQFFCQAPLHFPRVP